MKKVLIPALLLILAVAASVWMQIRPAEAKPSKKEPAIPGSMHIAQLSDGDEDSIPLPEIPIREEEGVLLDGNTLMTDAPEGYFENALFIGDSRMQGLQLYGNIHNTTWYAVRSMATYNYDDGMSIYDLENETLITSLVSKGYKTINLTALLQEAQFETIYVSMGINEIGTPDVNTIIANYAEFLNMLQTAAPDANIIFISVMHVTKAYSDGTGAARLITNPRINELNAGIKGFQDGKKVFYLNINPLVDDENGALKPEYTWDHIHLQSAPCPIVTDYLRTHAIFRTD